MLEKLKEVRAKIESGWTTFAAARDSSGTPVVPNSVTACRWCLVGACSAVSDTVSQFILLVNTLELNIPGHLAEWNDSHTKEEVLALIDKAIANAA